MGVGKCCEKAHVGISRRHHVSQAFFRSTSAISYFTLEIGHFPPRKRQIELNTWLASSCNPKIKRTFHFVDCLLFSTAMQSRTKWKRRTGYRTYLEETFTKWMVDER
eukprot:scaffold1673_cov330-Pavlova_lutheri.AAC.7